ncbi:MAG: GntR family transcriptional regulator [Pseudomonadota bacterium]
MTLLQNHLRRETNRSLELDDRPTHGGLQNAVTDQVRSLILDGELKPGERVSEKALCDRLSVSRTPVREALKTLMTEGLIELIPNRGARVTALSLDDLAHVFPVMGALEALAGELAAERMGDADIAIVEAFHDDMVRHYEARDMKAYFSANQRIHEAFVIGAANPVLTEQYAQLSARMRLARYRANMSDTRWAQAVDEHEQMIDALKRGRAKTLGRILRSHLDHKFEVVKAEAAISV